jgi:hypothetical protein
MTFSHRRWHLWLWLLITPLVAMVLFLSLAWRTETL